MERKQHHFAALQQWLRDAHIRSLLMRGRGRSTTSAREVESARAKEEEDGEDEMSVPSLLVIELGAGNSIHSLRSETAVLLSRFPGAALIRVDPADARVRGRDEGGDRHERGWDIGRNGLFVGLRCGALEAMTRLAAICEL